MLLTRLLAVVLLVAVLAAPAEAYIDPGTGSYLLQVLLAGVFGTLFALRLYWTKLRDLVLRLFRRRSEPPAPRP